MQKLFTIKDIKSTGFSPIFQTMTVGLAERELKEITNQPESRIAKYPEDHSLWQIGEFDETTGEIIPHKPMLIMEAIAAKST